MFREFGPAPLCLELDFDSYEGPWQHVRRFRNRSGWLLVAEATIQSQHDLLRDKIMVACDDHEQPIPSFQARHLAECGWNNPIECMDLPPDVLDDLLCEEEGALIVRWHRQRSWALAQIYEQQLARIATIEGKAKAFIRRNDNRIADLRRRRRHPNATEAQRELLTAAIAELEAENDEIIAEMADTRAVVRRRAEDEEERLWSRADLLVEVEPLHLFRWHARSLPDRSFYNDRRPLFAYNGSTNLSAECEPSPAWTLRTAMARAARPLREAKRHAAASVVKAAVGIIPDDLVPDFPVGDQPAPPETLVDANASWPTERVAHLTDLPSPIGPALPQVSNAKLLPPSPRGWKKARAQAVRASRPPPLPPKLRRTVADVWLQSSRLLSKVKRATELKPRLSERHGELQKKAERLRLQLQLSGADAPQSFNDALVKNLKLAADLFADRATTPSSEL